MKSRLVLSLGISALVLLQVGSTFAQKGKAGRDQPGNADDEKAARADAEKLFADTEAEIDREDAEEIVKTLSSKRYEGRGTGLRGELKATAFIAEMFERYGLLPDGEVEDSYFQRFPFPTGFELAADNHARLVLEQGEDSEEELKIDLSAEDDYLPLALSGHGRAAAPEPAMGVFVGYGIQTKNYDSFAGLDVKGKWIATFRGVPEKNSRALQGGGSLVAKAQLAKKLGAAGIIYMKGFNDKIPNELVPLSTPIGGLKVLPALSISNEYAEVLLTKEKTDLAKGLEKIYRDYADRESVAGFETGFEMRSRIDLSEVTSHGRNVLGRLQVGDKPTNQVVMIGAHADHVGFGNRGGSASKNALTRNRMHPGADDNGSGISGLLEVAQHLADLKARGELKAKRDIVFAAWTGEELGLIGSRFWVNEAQKALDDKDAGLHSRVAAYLNMDMIGRVRDNKLKVQGTGSSSVWPDLVKACSDVTTLDLQQDPNPHIPTDVASFTTAEIPVLAAFSGLHNEYHTPGDTAGKVNYDGIISATRFMAEVLHKVAAADEAPDFVKFERNQNQSKVIIGFGPRDTGSGITVDRITPGSAAEKAGLAVGDVLVELNNDPVTDLKALQRILRKLEPGKSYPMRVRRGEESQSLTVVPDKR